MNASFIIDLSSLSWLGWSGASSLQASATVRFRPRWDHSTTANSFWLTQQKNELIRSRRDRARLTGDGEEKDGDHGDRREPLEIHLPASPRSSRLRSSASTAGVSLQLSTYLLKLSSLIGIRLDCDENSKRQAHLCFKCLKTKRWEWKRFSSCSFNDLWVCLSHLFQTYCAAYVVVYLSMPQDQEVRFRSCWLLSFFTPPCNVSMKSSMVEVQHCWLFFTRKRGCLVVQLVVNRS